ncbi:MAG TPA: nucleotidyltransferase domain-containing protein [Chitinophagales bacterium]|nr:nucleotidyltransferase domain-containing protein [Chitinophagales bacterium]HRK26564.1 nucleotidyltransferase domain-containing protein [Chitinophagales bacterium]
MLPPLLKAHLSQITTLLQQHKVERAYLFGSAVTPAFNEQSDIDMLITLQSGLTPLEKGELMWNLQFALEDLLHRDVDLLQESTPKNPYFVREINASKIVIYE